MITGFRNAVWRSRRLCKVFAFPLCAVLMNAMVGFLHRSARSQTVNDDGLCRFASARTREISSVPR